MRFANEKKTASEPKTVILFSALFFAFVESALFYSKFALK